MTLLEAFLLLLAVGSAAGVQYEVRGHINLISANDINVETFNEDEFNRKLEDVRTRMFQIIGTDFVDFLVYDYKIHGIDTTIFHATLTLIQNPSISRQNIIDRIDATDDVEIYFLRKIELEVVSAPRFRAVRADVDSCLNGGILLPNATCSCPNYYSGANCEVVSCRNNGIGENGRCACPPGLYSTHCEARTCSANIESAVDLSSQSLILVINTRLSMAYDLNSIIGNIQNLITDYKNQEVTIANYITTIYRYSKSGVYIMETSTFTTANDLTDYLTYLALGQSTDDQPHLDAIVAAQSTSPQMRPKSTVYVFADTENVNDPTPSTLLTNTNESLAVQQTLSWRNKIFIVLSQLPSSPLDPTNNHFDVLRRVVTAVHGDLLIVDKGELDTVLGDLLYYCINAQNTYVQYYNSVSKSIPLLSDTATANSYVLLTTENGVSVPSVQDKNGNVLKADVAGKRFALYRVVKSATDTITITGDTVPTHNTRVWFTSPNDVLISYSEDDTVDNNYAHTFKGFVQRPSLYSSFDKTTGLSVTRLDSFNSTVILDASSAARRADSCIYPFQLPVINSSIAGPFVHKVEITAASRTYYRVVPGYSFTPATHSAPAWNCINGGTRSGTGSCFCASNWQGQHCEIPVCQNGGTIDKFPNGGGRGYCICPFGVSGSFCETTVCNSTSSDTFESYSRTFGLVVQNSLSAAQAMYRLNDGLRAMLNQGKSTDFADFVFTTYKMRNLQGSVSPLVHSDKFTNASVFLNATTTDSIGYSYSPSGDQPGLLALETTIRSMDYDKSSIFFFTDSESSVHHGTWNFTDIVKTAVERQIEISIVIIPPYGDTSMCSDANIFETYDILVKQTGGNFINLCQQYTANGDPVFNFIGSYGSTHHHTEVISYYNVPDCSNFLSRDFYLSSRDSDSEVYVVIHSPTIQNFTVQVVDSSSGKQQTLVADTYSVPFFASHQLKVASDSSLQYKLSVNTDKKEQCFVRVTERSQFAVYLGFSPDPSVDRYSKDLTYGTFQQPVVHLSSTLQSEPTLTTTSYDNKNNVAFTSTFSKRTSGCKYEYVMNDQFACNTADDTFTVETTVTTNEVTIMRTQRAFCNELDGCMNGGILLGGECQCLNNYSGLHCEMPLCQNNGVLNEFKCNCGGQYDGDTCQYVRCNDWNFVETHDPREYNFQQVVFVVEENTRNTVVSDSFLANNIGAFVDATDDVNNPKQYTLVTFDDSTVRVIVSSAHKDVFVSAFQTALIYSLDSPSTVKTLEALNTAYNTLVELPGIIYVFSATPTASYTAAVRQRFGVQVNVIMTGLNVTSLLPSNVNPYLTASARQSNGRVLLANAVNTPQLLLSLASTVNENQLILDDGAKDCSSGVSFQFPIESLASSFNLVATGAQLSVTVTDENAKNVDLTNTTTFIDVNTVVRTISTVNHKGGFWNVVVKGPSSCYLQIRTTSPLQVIPRFTNDQGDDFGSGTPRVGAGSVSSTYITFRIMDSYNSNSNNYGSSITSIEQSDTDLESPWDTTSNFANTTVLQRDPLGCASQFVTPLITWTSTYEKFIVRGIDSNNNSFQRTFFFNRNAKAADCQNNASVDKYGFCQCDSNHIGNLCQFRKCQNGGVSAYGLCDCPNGYYGDFCELYISV